MTQPTLADTIPTLVEFVSTHAWEAGIEYRRGFGRSTLVFTVTPDRRGKNNYFLSGSSLDTPG
jgi:hypothetical protein